jgi:hypothetical protein
LRREKAGKKNFPIIEQSVVLEIPKAKKAKYKMST